ncbi:MAG: hypothetical protein DRI56_06680 [Chloroflexota bacterium]|nr:MAG: hypothetical protein DRI56_06680 [Chloroflexota bacterium]
MHLAFTSYSSLVFFAAVIALFMVVWSMRHAARGGNWFSVVMIGAFFWSAGYGLEMLSTDLQYALFWVKVQYLGIAIVPVSWLFLVISYTRNQQWLNRQNLIRLLAIPLITLLIAWTNELHELVWVNPAVESNPFFNHLVFEQGLWYWINVIYAYTLISISTILLIIASTKKEGIYKQQSIVLLIFSITIWFGNIIYMLGLSPYQLDLSPIIFSFGGLIIAWELYRYRILDIVPIARDAIMDIIPDGIVVINHQGIIIDINQAAQQIIGKKQSGLGHPIAEVLSQWPRSLSFYDANKELEVVSHLEQVLKIDEKKFSFDFSIAPLKNTNGYRIGSLLTWHDITSQKQSEEKLRKLSRAVEQSASAIVITDLNGTIEYVNPAFSKVTGYTAKEAIGENPRILKSGKMDTQIYKKLWADITNGKVWFGEILNKNKSGELYWESSTIAPITNENGKPTHYVAVKENISQRKRMEQELAEARDQALKASHLKSRLLTNVSHDMKTPLGAIVGYSEMIKEGLYGPVTERQKEKLDIIFQNSNVLSEYVSNLLEQSKIESGNITFNFSSFTPQELISSIADHVSLLAKNKKIDLNADIVSGAPKTITGDFYWLQRILTNMVNNAIKFTEEGSVTISILPHGENKWDLRVSDTGAGISIEDQERIFVAFQKGDKDSKIGAGLGLAIVKEITGLMGGTITLESEVGRGSTFTITLPIKN